MMNPQLCPHYVLQLFKQKDREAASLGKQAVF